MFDIGLSELGVIGLVALIVLGPERLPKVARACGRWVGKLQRYINDVKADIHRETALAELKAVQEDIHKTANELHHIQQQTEDEMHEIHQALSLDDISTKKEPNRRKQKKLRSRSHTLPIWYKHQQGIRTYVQSGAARVKRHRKHIPS